MGPLRKIHSNQAFFLTFCHGYCILGSACSRIQKYEAFPADNPRGTGKINEKGLSAKVYSEIIGAFFLGLASIVSV